MGRSISLFADYHTGENSVTNYCGLMLKLVYQESPKLLNKFLDYIFEGEAEVPFVGPTFEQQNAKQMKRKHSIPDLEIKQDSFQILVETKLTDWYHKDQLENHIEGFSDNIVNKILILLCNFDDKNCNQNRQDFKIAAKKKNISVVEVTFEDFLNGMIEVCKTPQLEEYLMEFQEYLDRQKLLPTWKFRLDVVNCGRTREEILEAKVYMCPNSGGQYRHERAKFFGTYWDKKVEYLYIIYAVVVVDRNCQNSEIKWKNSEESDSIFINRAVSAIKKYRQDEIKRNGIQVFLLSSEKQVNFIKDSKGGMFGSKKYFIVNDAVDIDRCVSIINEKKWSDFENK